MGCLLDGRCEVHLELLVRRLIFCFIPCKVLSSSGYPQAVPTFTPIPFVVAARRSKTAVLLMLLACFLLFSVGCERLRHERHDKVYVFVRQTYLHDRVAAVSNRVGEVVNGQQLEVLQSGRRFLKVQTEKKEIGWIEERAVIDSKTFKAFEELGVQHKDDPVVSTGTLRDDVYMHLTPGRDTDRFYLLPGNSKVQLLVRASILKGSAPGAAPVPKPVTPPPAPAATTAAKTAKTGAGSKTAPKPDAEAEIPSQPEPAPPPMEDWWLVRDGQGHAGWMLAGRMDVDVPDEIGVYAEGQRIVGAYLLNRVYDSEATTADHMVSQYVTVLSPPKAGLPFDFDQIRVFTWSLKRHRYETAFRLHPIQGFLPVRVTNPSGGAPVFNFQIANGGNVATDPATGISRPASQRTITYMLTDTQVKRTGADQGPIPVGHLEGAKSKAAKAAKKDRKP